MVQQACSRQKLIRGGSGFSHLVHIPAMTSPVTSTTPSDGRKSTATPPKIDKETILYMNFLSNKELEEYLLRFDIDSVSNIVELLFTAREEGADIYQRICKISNTDDMFSEIAGHSFDNAILKFQKSCGHNPVARRFINTYFDCQTDEYWLEHLSDYPEHIPILKVVVSNTRRFKTIVPEK
jgi:hypothetical protein